MFEFPNLQIQVNGDKECNIVDFKLSPCADCCMLSFGWSPGGGVTQKKAYNNV